MTPSTSIIAKLINVKYTHIEKVYMDVFKKQPSIAKVNATQEKVGHAFSLANETLRLLWQRGIPGELPWGEGSSCV